MHAKPKGQPLLTESRGPAWAGPVGLHSLLSTHPPPCSPALATLALPALPDPYQPRGAGFRAFVPKRVLYTKHTSRAVMGIGTGGFPRGRRSPSSPCLRSEVTSFRRPLTTPAPSLSLSGPCFIFFVILPAPDLKLCHLFMSSLGYFLVHPGRANFHF